MPLTVAFPGNFIRLLDPDAIAPVEAFATSCSTLTTEPSPRMDRPSFSAGVVPSNHTPKLTLTLGVYEALPAPS